jgi:hypothetical protein
MFVVSIFIFGDTLASNDISYIGSRQGSYFQPTNQG